VGGAFDKTCGVSGQQEELGWRRNLADSITPGEDRKSSIMGHRAFDEQCGAAG
jgi:hypothetical protein